VQVYLAMWNQVPVAVKILIDREAAHRAAAEGDPEAAAAAMSALSEPLLAKLDEASLGRGAAPSAVCVCVFQREAKSHRAACLLVVLAVCVPSWGVLAVDCSALLLPGGLEACCVRWPPLAACQLTMRLILLLLSLCVAVSDPACAVFLCCLAVWLCLTLYGCAVC
jgi:hypothetical protein